jgi:cytochrome oxidase Cu insertion factor (SCO1/SenC/PrrC family)
MTRWLLLFSLLALIGCGQTRPTGSTPETLDLDYPVGSFSLTERSGRAITEKDLLGKVWVASFVFTRCTGPCPAVTATVRRLQTELADQPGVMFVTFTVDPARDGLDDLKKYADHFKADPARWLFLTGDEPTIHKLLQERFKQTAMKKTGPDVKPGDEFDHSTRLLLVDKKGVIRASFEGIADDRYPDGADRFEAGLKRLKEKAAKLAAE